MSNLPEQNVYISQLKAAGFTNIQVCQFVVLRTVLRYNISLTHSSLSQLRVATFSQRHIVAFL